MVISQQRADTCHCLVHVPAQRVRQGRLFKRLSIKTTVPELRPSPARAQPKTPTLKASSEAATVHHVVGTLHHELEQPKVAGRNAKYAAELLRHLRNQRGTVR